MLDLSSATRIVLLLGADYFATAQCTRTIVARTLCRFVSITRADLENLRSDLPLLDKHLAQFERLSENHGSSDRPAATLETVAQDMRSLKANVDDRLDNIEAKLDRLLTNLDARG